MSLKKVAEAYEIFEAGVNGGLRDRARLQESLTTSDFPALLSAGLNRKLQSNYQTLTPAWQEFSSKELVPNFKEQKLYGLDLVGGLELVPEATEYPAGSLVETVTSFKVGKYGERLHLTREKVANDELGAFRNLPDMLSRSARETEARVSVEVLLQKDMKDINKEFFKAANGNAPKNLPLNRENLRAALTELRMRKDKSGNILRRPDMILMVPPSLEWQANALVSGSEVRTTQGTETIIAANDLAGSVRVVVDPLLAANSHAKAAGTWFLLPDPKKNPARPAVITGFLNSQQAPQLRVKADTGNRVGGGAIDPLQGSFNDDTIQFRVDHIVGAALADPTFTYVSYGS
ncbi:phage major capsid protein [Dermabacteraceae bacterium P7006]